METDEKKLKMMATIGMRASFGLSCLDFIKQFPDIMILTSDVSTSAGLDRFRKQFTSNYLDVGISEQNLIGIATGLSSENFKVITTTFAPFQTLRCCEQIKVNLGYMKSKVLLVGLASGLNLGNLGFTQQPLSRDLDGLVKLRKEQSQFANPEGILGHLTKKYQSDGAAA